MSLKKVVLGTKNKDKRRELQVLLKGAHVQVLTLEDFSNCPDVHEDGRTFEENAKKKARFFARHTKMLTLADDSGLMVSRLNGRPGVYSARFAGPGCTYHDNNEKLLRLLQKVPLSKRQAKFVCVMALYDHRGLVKIVRGECRGKIAFSQKGANGFGYDPVFIPQGFLKTFAELSPKTKNRISHRGKALRKARQVVLKYLAHTR